MSHTNFHQIKNSDEFKRFFIKYTIIASSLTWFIGSYLKDFLRKIVEVLVDPFFSLDLNSDGKPDLKQLDAYSLNVLGRKFPLGEIIVELIKLLITVGVIYVMVKVMIHYTGLIDLK